eukprot:Skav225085  [mRNA]  locus=scaffold1341:52003:54420:- [translate_table: standard]
MLTTVPVQREPSKSPRDNTQAPATPTSNLPKKRLHSKTSPVQAKQLFHEVQESPPLKKLSRTEVMAQLGISSQNEPSGSAVVAAEVEDISSTEDEHMIVLPGSSTDRKPSSPSIDGSKTFWVNSAIPCLMRSINGKAEQASMKAGPDGFAIAIFQNPFEEKATEIPNLNLGSVKTPEVSKKPAAHKQVAQKRPAATVSTSGSGSDENGPMAEAAPAAPVTMGYTFMTYRTGAVAIRESKLGKRQLFQIMNREKSQQQLQAILEEAKQKLLAGEPAEQALSFNRLGAQQLGERLLSWQGGGGGHVDSNKVWKSKKNKGKKRLQWQQEAINYHRGLPKGTGKGHVEVVPDDDEVPVGTPGPGYPDAPWWLQNPTEDKESKEDYEPETEVGEPLGKRSKKDDDHDDEGGPFFNGGSRSPLFAVFGP